MTTSSLTDVVEVTVAFRDILVRSAISQKKSPSRERHLPAFLRHVGLTFGDAILERLGVLSTPLVPLP